MSKNFNRHFTKEDICVANQYMEKCTKLLVIRKMKTKTTIWYHYELIRMVVIKKTGGKNVGDNMKKMECSCLVDGTIKSTATFENSVTVSEKVNHVLNIKPTHSSSTYLQK